MRGALPVHHFAPISKLGLLKLNETLEHSPLEASLGLTALLVSPKLIILEHLELHFH